jgi:hypothetical protein
MFIIHLFGYTNIQFIPKFLSSLNFLNRKNPVPQIPAASDNSFKNRSAKASAFACELLSV